MEQSSASAARIAGKRVAFWNSLYDIVVRNLESPVFSVEEGAYWLASRKCEIEKRDMGIRLIVDGRGRS